MSDGKALMKAIIESPDDDAPRLVYADWLDEEGDSGQAAYIRAQCALHGPGTPDDQRREAAARVRALPAWRPPKLRGIKWGDDDRGYPRRVDARRWADLRAAWDTIFSVAPVVWIVVPKLTSADLDELLRLPETRLLQYVFLSFDGPLDRVARRLAEAEATDGWIDLVLDADHEDYLTDRGVEAMLSGRHLRRLASLSTPLLRVSEDGREALYRWTASRVV